VVHSSWIHLVGVVQEEPGRRPLQLDFHRGRTTDGGVADDEVRRDEARHWVRASL